MGQNGRDSSHHAGYILKAEQTGFAVMSQEREREVSGEFQFFGLSNWKIGVCLYWYGKNCARVDFVWKREALGQRYMPKGIFWVAWHCSRGWSLG